MRVAINALRGNPFDSGQPFSGFLRELYEGIVGERSTVKYQGNPRRNPFLVAGGDVVDEKYVRELSHQSGLPFEGTSRSNGAGLTFLRVATG
nr:hypothetical protein [Streptomyces sp. MNP-20]